MKMKRHFVAVALLASMTSVARAEQIEYSNSAKNGATVATSRLLPKDVALTLTVKDLDASWQYVALNNVNQMMDRDGAPYQVLSEYEAIDRALGVAPNVYLTQWQTANSGGQSFLIAYKIESLLTNEKQRAFFAETYVPSAFATKAEFVAHLKQSADARTLKLTLLNLQTIGVVSDIKPYNAKERDGSLNLSHCDFRFSRNTEKRF